MERTGRNDLDYSGVTAKLAEPYASQNAGAPSLEEKPFSNPEAAGECWFTVRYG